MKAKPAAPAPAEEILDTAKVTSKGQITVPIAVRKAFNIDLGDRVVFLIRDGELLVRKSK